MARVSADVVLPDGHDGRRSARVGARPAERLRPPRPDGAVVFAVDDLPPHTFVEAHLLFPQRVLADAAHRRRAGAAEPPGRGGHARSRGERGAGERPSGGGDRARIDLIAWAVGGAVTAIALAIWLVLFFRTGREYRPAFRAKYLREVPEGVPPALAGAAVAHGRRHERRPLRHAAGPRRSAGPEHLAGRGHPGRRSSSSLDRGRLDRQGRVTSSPSPWCGCSNEDRGRCP